MTIVDVVLAVLFGLGGVRSLWIWSRRRFEGTDVVDHLLYALNLTGRIGLWFAFAAFFVLDAAARDGGPGNGPDDIRWFALVPLALAAMQFVGAFALGRRSSDR